MNASAALGGRPISWRAPRDRLTEPHPFGVGYVLDQAQQRRPGRDEGAAGLLLGQAIEARVQRGPVLVEERLQLDLERLLGHVERRPPRSHNHDRSITITERQFQHAPLGLAGQR